MTNKEAVELFAQHMERELNANARKGDWRTWYDHEEQMKEAWYHHTKLQSAIDRYDLPAIKEHAADCANFYMFITSTFGVLKETNDHPGQLKLF